MSTCSSLISKLHLVNGAQFFKVNLALAILAGTASGGASASALVVPSTKIYASIYKHHINLVLIL